MKGLLQGKSRGQSLIEFALVLPVLLMFAMFILDFGRAIYYYSVLFNAAREGARYGAIRQSVNRLDTTVTDAAGIINAALEHVYGMPPGDVNVVPSKPIDAVTGEVEVLVVNTSYCFVPVTPFVTRLVGAGCFTLTSESKMFLER
jgi:hypothetical protein